MRAPVRLDDRLLMEAKRRAAPSPAGPVVLPTGGSGGLQPGVSIDRNAELLDLIDTEP